MSNKYPQINIGSLCPPKTRAELWKGATVVWNNSSIPTPCAIAETYDRVSLKDIRNWLGRSCYCISPIGEGLYYLIFNRMNPI